MRKVTNKKFLALSMAVAMAASAFAVRVPSVQVESAVQRVGEAGAQEIPGTVSSFSSYNPSFLSATGFAAAGVNDRTADLNTSKHVQVKTATEFLNAINEAKKGNVTIIEVMRDLELGYTALSGAANVSQLSSGGSSSVVTNPELGEVGAGSHLRISGLNGLTIFSQYGAALKHIQFNFDRSCNDVVMRNLSFDGLWMWDNTGTHKDQDWTYLKINGSNFWIDHCDFTIAMDGNIDMENGATGITISWCKFGLPADENPDENSMIYKSIMFMEEKYQNGEKKVNGATRYADLRDNGATPEQIMAYAAYHSKVHLNGAGDKDYMNYTDPNGNETADGNQNIAITFAYDWYQNVGQRVPMIRQGVGHLMNCYMDDMGHMTMHNLKTADGKTPFKSYGGYSLSRCINARNGASIAADTCVYYGVDEPIIGNEIQGDDTPNMTSEAAMLFKNAQNRSLIVNSKTTNVKGETYSGSSWDKNGSNLFVKDSFWSNSDRTKCPTYRNWAWKSNIVSYGSGSTFVPYNQMIKEYKFLTGVKIEDIQPFNIEYDYEKELEYSYQLVPLNDVESTLKAYSGCETYQMSAADWVRTSYTKDETIEPVNEQNKVMIAGSAEYEEEQYITYVGDTWKILPKILPVDANNMTYTWTSKTPTIVKIDENGNPKAIAKGNAKVTCTVTSKNGTTVSATATILVKDASLKPSEEPTPTPIVTDQPTSTPVVTDPATEEPTSTPVVTDPATEEPTSTPVVTDPSTEEPTSTPVITEEPSEEPTNSPAPSYKLGDVDGNGVIELDDAQITLRAALRIITLEGDQEKAADADKDGVITLDDAQLILRAALRIAPLEGNDTVAQVVQTLTSFALKLAGLSF